MGERTTQLPAKSEPRLRIRSRRAAALVGTALTLNACTGDGAGLDDDNFGDRVVCTAEGEWKPVEGNFENAIVAVPLEVDAQKVAAEGTFGAVACADVIELRLLDIPESNEELRGQVVPVESEVDGETVTSNCLVYYINEDDPAKGEAVCVPEE